MYIVMHCAESCIQRSDKINRPFGRLSQEAERPAVNLQVAFQRAQLLSWLARLRYLHSAWSSACTDIRA